MRPVRHPIMWKFVPSSLVLCGALLFAACGAGGNSTAGNGPTATAVPPTATPKPKPTTIPQVTQAFCQSALTVDQANQIMQPSTPATMITVETDTDFSICTYESANPVPVLTIGFQGWTGPIPVTQADFTAAANQLISKLGASGGSLTAFTPVSGIGDQAAFMAFTVPTSQFTINTDVFYVLYGKLLFDCAVYNLGPLPSNATEESALQQCAHHVLSVL